MSDASAQEPIHPICSEQGCVRPTRTRRAALCAMHYHRQYRHGSTQRVATHLQTADQTSRYRSTHRPDHPLALASGRIYVHRMVLFDDIGAGSHPCHWCGRLVTWLRPLGDPDELTVDHLNGIRDDNRIDNLVPACRECNSARALALRHEALVRSGFWSNNDTIARLATPGRRQAS